MYLFTVLGSYAISFNESNSIRVPSFIVHTVTLTFSLVNGDWQNIAH